MAGSSPRISNDGAMDFIRPQLVKSIPHSVTKFVCDYDIDRIGKMLLAGGDRSLVEKMEAFKKNLESFKKPSAHGAIIDGDYEVDEYEDYEDDEVDEDEDEVDEDEELAGDEKKPASDVGLQVRDEGEPECKKPRLSESFECQELEEEIEA